MLTPISPQIPHSTNYFHLLPSSAAEKPHKTENYLQQPQPQRVNVDCVQRRNIGCWKWIYGCLTFNPRIQTETAMDVYIYTCSGMPLIVCIEYKREENTQISFAPWFSALSYMDRGHWDHAQHVKSLWIICVAWIRLIESRVRRRSWLRSPKWLYCPPPPEGGRIVFLTSHTVSWMHRVWGKVFFSTPFDACILAHNDGYW